MVVVIQIAEGKLLQHVDRGNSGIAKFGLAGQLTMVCTHLLMTALQLHY